MTYIKCQGFNTYETLTGEEIENIVIKYLSKDKLSEKPEDKDDKSSALQAMGLKPKIVLKNNEKILHRACNFYCAI